MNDPARRHAVVVGGGVAGLVAALGLRRRGFAVSLLESRGWLGGRAFSARERGGARELDNGPHAMLGCYRAMFRLLADLGSERLVQRDPALRLACRTATGAAAQLRLSRLPVPLALPWALARLPLPARARLQLVRGAAAALRSPPEDWTLADWLHRHGQAGVPAAWFWRPLCCAIMNVDPGLAGAGLLLATLREAFGGRAADAAFALPRVPWQQVLGAPAAVVLPARGIDVRLHARVAALACADGEVVAVHTTHGERLPLRPGRDLVVAAVPWHALGPWLAAPVPAVAAAARLGTSPIVSAVFATASDAVAPPDEGHVTTLVDGEPFHFLYRTPGAPRREFALLAGGNRALDGQSVAAIEALARAQLARHYPGFDAATVATVRIRKEARATFVAGPSAPALRPRPGRLTGGPRNLLVCGDWTDCGLPSTLEGAARSAEALLRALAEA